MRISESDRKRNHIGTFRFGGQDVRMYGSWVQPWFVLEDVKRAAELPNTLDVPLKYRRMLNEVGWLINELGLYRVLFQADTPRAQRMADRVYEDIMPEVRRYRTMRITSHL